MSFFSRVLLLVSVCQLFSCKIAGAMHVDDIKLDEYDDYVLLSSDVQEYYKASSVFITYAGDDESMHTTTLMLHLIREFSSKYVLSFVQNYTDVIYYQHHYAGRVVRPLFVVLLNSVREVEMFQQVTREFDMSFPFWLVIFTEPILDMCSDPRGNFFNLAFDTEMIVKCYGDPTLREWYSVQDDRTIICELATWDSVSRLQLINSKSLYERRYSLGGKVLRIAAVKESPFITNHQSPLNGLFAVILDELSVTLNFSMSIVYSEDAYGMYNRTTGRWTGVIGRLTEGEVDLGVGEFTMTGQRLDAVDFTLPIMLSRNHIYVRQPDGTALNWSAFFRVYAIDVWITIEAVYALTSLVITIIRLAIKDKPIEPNHVSENYLYVWGIYCQQGLPDFPTASPLRIAYFSVLVTAVILLAIYSACLISYLTVTSPSLPFSDLDEFSKDGSYKLIVFQQSADYDLFDTSTDEVLKRMMNLMLDTESLPKTMMNGFRQVCNNKLGFYATEAVKTKVSARIPCDLVYLESGRIDSLGMTLSKGSQYSGVINYHLQKFKDLGIMNRLRSRVYRRVYSADNKYNPVNVKGIVTILLILGTGVVLSIVILMCEIASHRTKSTKENRKIISNCKNRITVTKNTFFSTENLRI